MHQSTTFDNCSNFFGLLDAAVLRDGHLLVGYQESSGDGNTLYVRLARGPIGGGLPTRETLATTDSDREVRVATDAAGRTLVVATLPTPKHLLISTGPPFRLARTPLLGVAGTLDGLAINRAGGFIITSMANGVFPDQNSYVTGHLPDHAEPPRRMPGPIVAGVYPPVVGPNGTIAALADDPSDFQQPPAFAAIGSLDHGFTAVRRLGNQAGGNPPPPPPINDARGDVTFAWQDTRGPSIATYTP